MFFGPTLGSVTNDYFVHFLCLSSGGTIRAEELEKSAQYFNVHEHKCIFDEKLIDGMKEVWCEETIIKYVKSYVELNNIKAIFTFDGQGVSGHINHRAIYNALSKLEK